MGIIFLKKLIEKPKKICAIAVIYFAITFILLTLPGNAFPKETFLSKLHFDKWVHVGMFALLVIILTTWYYSYNKEKLLYSFIWIALAVIAYGLLMEYIQKWFITNRSFDVGDIMADAGGAIVGVISSYYCLKKIDPRGNRGRNQN